MEGKTAREGVMSEGTLGSRQRVVEAARNIAMGRMLVLCRKAEI